MVARADHRGLTDWLAQRVTALLLAAYTAFILLYLAANHPIHYAVWRALFHHTTMQVLTLLTLFSMMWHAWIGLQIILADYVKVVPLRLMLSILIILLCVSYLAWGLFILLR